MDFASLQTSPLPFTPTARNHGTRFAMLDWHVHHGNSTKAIFYENPDALIVSIDQNRNHPRDSGALADHSADKEMGANLNIPLPPSVGHTSYVSAMDSLAMPAIRAHKLGVIVIPCGFDGAACDPLGRMLATAEAFRLMTRQVMVLADDLCSGRLMIAHEGSDS